MSGGRYPIEGQIDNIIDSIKDVISKNRNIDDISRQLWTIKKHPSCIDIEAENYANKELDIQRPRSSIFDLYSDEDIKLKNKLKRDKLRSLIKTHNDLVYEYNYSNKTINKFKKAIDLLEKTRIYIHRIDYLLEGDDSEDRFHERLKEDLSKLEDNK